MNPERLYPVLYDLSATMGAEVSERPLIRRMLQRLMLHTGLPAALWLEKQEQVWHISRAVGLGRNVEGSEVQRGWHDVNGSGWVEDRKKIAALGLEDGWRSLLALFVGDEHQIVLLSNSEPDTSLPWTEAFQPVMGNLCKALHLCRLNDEKTRTLAHKVANRTLDLRESEARFRALIEQSPLSIQLYDADGTSVLVNPAWEKLWGTQASALEGYNLFEDRQLAASGLLDQIRPAFNGEQVFIDTHAYNPAKNPGLNGPDRTFWLRAHIYPLRDNVGNVSHVVVMHEDVSDKIEAEKLGHRLQQILELSPDMVCLADRQGRVTYMNQAARSILLLDKAENVPQLMIADLHPADEAERMIKKVLPLVEQEGQWIGETTFLCRDGRNILTSQLVLAHKSSNGELEYYSTIVRDVTEERRQQSKMEHVQRLESLGVLAGGIAHDFNNLLTAIMGHAALAKSKSEVMNPAIEHLAAIEETSQRAADLCKQMLAYSGKGRFVVQPVNLSELVEEMVRLLEVSIYKSVVMRYELTENLPAIEVDLAQMQQIIMNLVINANEAIGECSGNIMIATGMMHADADYLGNVYVQEDQLEPGRYVYLEVSDTGCGMGEETKKRLFEPFFTTKFTGRGLGMSAILGIVRGHHGAIKVYSEEGKGSTLKVLFPVVDQDAISLRREQQDQPAHGSGTVLIVDDEETIREVASLILENAGYRTIMAVDGLDAVEKLKLHVNEIDCVLLDMTMPRMGGEEAFSEMRRIRPDIKVLLSSGYNQQTATQRFTGKGLAGFVQKPYLPNVLLAKLAEILQC